MKKISCFLVAVMLFIAMASPFMPASTVQAFSYEDIDWSQRTENSSSKIEIGFHCFIRHNDGYAYAFVYEDHMNGEELNADHFPELYDFNKNKVAHFESFYKEVNKEGDTAYVYKLKIDKQDEFQVDSNGSTWLYYRIMGKNGNLSEKFIPYNLFPDDYGVLSVFDNSAYVPKENQSQGDNNDSDKKKTTYRTPVSNAIKQVVSTGGSAEISGITALSYDEMKEISKNPDAKLVMHFTYNDVKYKVIVTGKDAVLDPTIPWYGPLYLAGKYGNALATAE